jgi:hypothetical protein
MTKVASLFFDKMFNSHTSVSVAEKILVVGLTFFIFSIILGCFIVIKN